MKQLPYNTGKVLIGCRHERSKRSHVTPEGEFIQSVLSGEYHRAKRERVQMVWYVVAVWLIFVLVGVFA